MLNQRLNFICSNGTSITNLSSQGVAPPCSKDQVVGQSSSIAITGRSSEHDRNPEDLVFSQLPVDHIS